MKAPDSITTPAQYLASLPDERRADGAALHKAIVKAVPKLKPCIVYGMLGYGKFHYKYESGREGDTAVIALASQKAHFSLYVMADELGGKSLVERNSARLGKVTVGKSCIRFKKLEHLELPVVLELVKEAARYREENGGLST